MREPYVRTGLEKEVRSRFPLLLKCTAFAVLRPLLPFPNPKMSPPPACLALYGYRYGVQASPPWILGD